MGALHCEEVPLPHPREGLLHLSAHPTCSCWANCKASQPGYSRGYHEVLFFSSAGAVGQGIPTSSAAPCGGGHAEALLQQEAQHQVTGTTSLSVSEVTRI